MRARRKQPRHRKPLPPAAPLAAERDDRASSSYETRDEAQRIRGVDDIARLEF